MKNEEVWSHYKAYTKDITEISRKVSFGGLAVCWFFKGEGAVFPPAIINAIIGFVAFFLFDILQSLMGALLHKAWIRREEKRQWKKTESIEGDYLKPAWLDRPVFVLFLFKLISLFTAFFYVGIELFSRN